MVGQLHELVDEVRFIDVTGNGTQLFVGGETLPGRGERIRYNCMYLAQSCIFQYIHTCTYVCMYYVYVIQHFL